MSEINLIFIGDELITGRGDARALGWVGRVMARTNSLEVIDAPSWSTLAVPVKLAPSCLTVGVMRLPAGLFLAPATYW